MRIVIKRYLKDFFCLFVAPLACLTVVSCYKKSIESSLTSSTSISAFHGGEEEQSVTYYTCSMHPQVREKEKGKCPICHMNLVRVEIPMEDHRHAGSIDSMDSLNGMDSVGTSYGAEASGKVGTSAKFRISSAKGKASKVIARVKLRKSQLNHFNPEFFPVPRMKMTKKVRLLGLVFPSEEKESHITARVRGRVEKVYVRSTGSFVKKGDPIVDFYSPPLITAGEEYLLAKKSYESDIKNKEFRDMVKQSEDRLRLWGVRRSQFEKWHERKKIPKNITIYSLSTGVVKQRQARVGKYFKEGEIFFELSNLKDVWVEMDIYEHDSSLVQMGQQVEMEFTALPGEGVEGHVDFISPVIDEKSRTLKVRVTVDNSLGRLKPGMVADVTLSVSIPGEPLVVPRSAVIDTGRRKVVWMRASSQESRTKKSRTKKFHAKVIDTGYESEGYVEVKKGLKEGEEVVIEGNFLLDAQAQLFGGYEDMK